MLFLSCWVLFYLIKGRQCRKHIGSIVLMREFADTAPEARYHLWKIARKLRKSRTLFASRTLRVSRASVQIFHEITFAQGHSLTHLVLRRCLPISSVLHLQEYHPVISYDLSRYPEFTYRKSVVRAFGSFAEQRLSPSCGKRMSQIPATFPRITFAVDYCGLSFCLSSEKPARSCW